MKNVLFPKCFENNSYNKPIFDFDFWINWVLGLTEEEFYSHIEAVVIHCKSCNVARPDLKIIPNFIWEILTKRPFVQNMSRSHMIKANSSFYARLYGVYGMIGDADTDFQLQIWKLILGTPDEALFTTF